MSVKFLEKSHQYFSDKGELISVSKFFERFKPKVDWDKIAKNYAAKNGMTKKEVLELWEKKRNFSSQVGTKLHSIKEQQLLDDNDIVFYNKSCKKQTCTFQDGAKHSIPINELQNDTVYPELMIYDLEHMICGQSDKVIVTNGKINIWDYKTDKEITFKAFSSQWVDPRKLLPPLGHIEDANGNHYSIKMSLYMYLLWKANKGKFKPGQLIIEHVHLKRDPETDFPILDKDGNPIILKTVQIEIPYRKKEVIAMLKTLK